MSDNSDNGLDAEWLEALEVEDTGDDKGTDETVVNDDKGADDGTADDTGDDTKGDDTKGDDGDSKSADDGSDADKGAQDGNADDTDATKKSEATDDDADKTPDQKAIVKEAIHEIETSRAERASKYDTFKKEVAETLYPEGIDRQLRDSDGDPITGIDDLTNLINPATKDYFTDEEAGKWLLAAQKKLNEDVETVERFIEDVAETNLNLSEGAERVADKYAEILAKDDALKTRLLTAFNKTLIKDPKTGVAIKAPMDVEEFFDLALEPIVKQQAEEAEAKKKADEEAKKAAKTAQGERGDLKQNGVAETLKGADKEWAQAIKDYEEGA